MVEDNDMEKDYPCSCFGNYDKDAEECGECDMADECRVDSLKKDESTSGASGEEDSGEGYPGWCFGRYDGKVDECRECDMKEECGLATVKEKGDGDADK